MTLKRFFQLLLLATAICLIACILIVVRMNPELTPWWGFVLFYSALFGAVLGLAASLGLVVRLVTVRRIVPRYHILASLRQGLWCALAATGSLLLLRGNVWTWWIEALLLVVLLSLEGLFLAQTLPKRYHDEDET